MKRLEGRSALITGGGSGIGRAIAERFASEGAKVALCGRGEDALEATAAAIREAGGDARWYKLDVSDLESIPAVMDGAARDLGGLHILVNCAGVSGPTPVDEVTPTQWRSILATNLDGAFFASQAALRHIPDHDGGRIINIATIGGQIPFPGWTAYCASKAGLVGATRCLAMELAPRGITVNAILPGWVKSAMQQAGVTHIAAAMGLSEEEALPNILSDVPLGRMSDPDEVAAMATLLASDEGRGMTGSSVVISNGALMA